MQQLTAISTYPAPAGMLLSWYMTTTLHMELAHSPSSVFSLRKFSALRKRTEEVIDSKRKCPLTEPKNTLKSAPNTLKNTLNTLEFGSRAKAPGAWSSQ